MPLDHSSVLCEVINCVLAPRLCQIASGSASGFFRNGSHCRKVGVNLCLGYLSGHTLAEPWHLFQRISRCNGLRDALLAGRQALHIHDQTFTEHSAWVCVGFGTKWEHSGHHSGGNRYPKACRGLYSLQRICGPLKQSMWHREELLARERRRESSRMTFELDTFGFAGYVVMPCRLHTVFLGCHHGPLPSVDGQWP